LKTGRFHRLALVPITGRPNSCFGRSGHHEREIFARFHLDAGIGDAVMQPLEVLECRDWLGFAVVERCKVLMIPREHSSLKNPTPTSWQHWTHFEPLRLKRTPFEPEHRLLER
jgi:hypothetical protein